MVKQWVKRPVRPEVQSQPTPQSAQITNPYVVNIENIKPEPLNFDIDSLEFSKFFVPIDPGKKKKRTRKQ